MAEIKILSRTKLFMYPTPETPQAVIAITYQSGFMPPRIIYIPEVEYTLEKEKEAIKADLEKAEIAKPEVYEV